jgi:predicted cytidylate kinase
LLVTISGLPGSGTSTLSTRVSAQLGVERLDGGSVFRSMAADEGLTVAEFSSRAELDTAIDLALDARLALRAEQGDVVLESRLAGWIATRTGLVATRVWVECDPAERASRVAAREGIGLAQALEANAIREASEQQRYLSYYDIDLADRSIYDVILDSTSTPPDDLVARVVAAARR